MQVVKTLLLLNWTWNVASLMLPAFLDFMLSLCLLTLKIMFYCYHAVLLEPNYLVKYGGKLGKQVFSNTDSMENTISQNIWLPVIHRSPAGDVA